MSKRTEYTHLALRGAVRWGVQDADSEPVLAIGPVSSAKS